MNPTRNTGTATDTYAPQVERLADKIVSMLRDMRCSEAIIPLTVLLAIVIWAMIGSVGNGSQTIAAFIVEMILVAAALMLLLDASFE